MTDDLTITDKEAQQGLPMGEIPSYGECSPGQKALVDSYREQLRSRDINDAADFGDGLMVEVGEASERVLGYGGRSCRAAGNDSRCRSSYA